MCASASTLEGHSPIGQLGNRGLANQGLWNFPHPENEASVIAGFPSRFKRYCFADRSANKRVSGYIQTHDVILKRRNCAPMKCLVLGFDRWSIR